MRLIHLEINLDFADEFMSLSISQQLHKALTGKTSAVEDAVEPGVEFRSIKKRQLVSWHTDSCRVVAESIADPGESIGRMVALLQTVNKVAPIGKLCGREFISQWILPAEGYNFRLLEQKYREAFITHQPIWKNVFDSSVIIDSRINDLILHHQSGAMKARQLRQEYSEFKLEKIPEVFLFLWTSIRSNRKVDYAVKDIDSFSTTSLRHCKQHSELCEETWRRML